MAIKIAPVVFHGAVFIIYNLTILYHSKIPNSPGETHPAINLISKFKYLTFWNLIFQSVAFGLCLAYDLLSFVSWHSKLSKLKDAFFLTVAVPFGLNVFFTFWALYFYDKQLIFPKHIEAIFPPWLNHLVHTFILFPLLVELKLTPHVQPARSRGFSIIFSIILVYGIWIISLALYFEFWVYPFLAVLTWPGRFTFFAGNMLLTWVFYLVGEHVNKLMWGTKRSKKF